MTVYQDLSEEIVDLVLLEGEKMTQCEMILDYMRRTGSITQKEAYDALGCLRLSGRIYDLKHAGYSITSFMETKPNRFGKLATYTRYVLKEGAQDANAQNI